MKQTLEKIKLALDLKTAIPILVFVFWLWVTWSNLNNTQQQIIVKLDDLVEQQEKIVVKRDSDHKVIDEKLAWLEPAVQLIIKKIGL